MMILLENGIADIPDKDVGDNDDSGLVVMMILLGPYHEISRQSGPARSS